MSEKIESSKPSGTSQPGEGIRSIKSTSLFRVTNFELFVKPNKYVMAVGLIAITSCIAYISYMRMTATDPQKNTYIAIAEDGTQQIRKRTSRWD